MRGPKQENSCRLWMSCPQRDVFPNCICQMSPSQSDAKPKEVGIRPGEQSVASLHPWSYLEGFLFCFLFLLFPKEEHEVRQISWGMSQCCRLPRGLVAFTARVTVSDTSCHFQCSLLVPESAPNILPQEMSSHSVMKERKTFQKQFKAQYLGEKKNNPALAVCLEVF